MRNLGILYRVELKKILSKKIAWVLFLAILAIQVIVATSNLTMDQYECPEGKISGYDYYKDEYEMATALSGQKIDDAMLDRMQKAIHQYMEKYEEAYQKNDQFNEWDAAERTGYGRVFSMVYDATQDASKAMTISAEEYYRLQKENLGYGYQHSGLNEEEKAYWDEKYSKVVVPYTYSYIMSCQDLLVSSQFLVMCLLLSIAAALSGVFSQEKEYRTEALILSSVNGRSPVCLAKILAGCTVGLAEGILTYAVNLLVEMAAYGIDRTDVPIQLVISGSPWNLTVSQMLWILFGVMMLLSLLFSITTMLLSRLLGSAVPVMAIQTGVLLAGLFELPAGLGILANLWKMWPTSFLGWSVFKNVDLYHVFGGIFHVFQVAPVLYGLGIAAGFILLYLSCARMPKK